MSEVIVLTKSIERYACTICPAVFTTLDELKLHNYKVHSEQVIF